MGGRRERATAKIREGESVAYLEFVDLVISALQGCAPLEDEQRDG
jgi:hypothetical protein